jgi:hypothetical protein
LSDAQFTRIGSFGSLWRYATVTENGSYTFHDGSQSVVRYGFRNDRAVVIGDPESPNRTGCWRS